MSGLSKTCGSCTYFKRFQVGLPGGACHARPPVPILLGMQRMENGQAFPQINSFWPLLTDNEYCGDWGRALPDAVALEKLRLDEPVGQG